MHAPLWKWSVNIRQKSYFLWKWSVNIRQNTYFLGFLKHVSPNILKRTTTTRDYKNNIRGMTIKINNARWCNTIKKLFRCSTNNPVLSRKNSFRLTSFRLYLAQLSLHNLLRSEMVLTCETISWRWIKQDFELCFKFKIFWSVLFLRLLWETH